MVSELFKKFVGSAPVRNEEKDPAHKKTEGVTVRNEQIKPLPPFPFNN